MSKTVVLVGSLDTKGEEFQLVKNLIESQGCPNSHCGFWHLGVSPPINLKLAEKRFFMPGEVTWSAFARESTRMRQ